MEKLTTYVRTTRASTSMGPDGFVPLITSLIVDGKVIDSIKTISGLPGSQYQIFKSAALSKAGSYQPLPEAYYLIGKEDWEDGKDNFGGKIINDGIGPFCFALTPTSKSGRSGILEHLDWNKKRSPGTAGCLGYLTVEDMKKRIEWQRKYNPKYHVVNYGFHTVETWLDDEGPYQPKPQTSTASDSPKPVMEIVEGCPNFSSRGSQKITKIVNHYTVSRTADAAISWFLNPAAKVSAHYVIDRNGEIFQVVDPAKKAWHCYGNNDTTIGIEHVAMQHEALTSAQLAASVALQKWLLAEYHLKPDAIEGHRWMPKNVGHTDCPGWLYGEWTREAFEAWRMKNFGG